MSETYSRHWELLQLIPREPRKIDAGELYDKLRDQGYTTTIRTIQRDLNLLSGVFPLKCDERSKPYGWSWVKDYHVDIPGMSLQMALTFKMVEHFMPRLLPASALSYLAPYFEQAEKTLGDTNDPKMGGWLDKIRIQGRGLQLKPPVINKDVNDAVYDALLSNRQLAVSYLRKGDSEPKQYEVSPLGLVIRNSVIYLVCNFVDYPDIRQLVLHRIQFAMTIDNPRYIPDGFDLDEYIDAGEFSLPVDSKPIQLKIIFDPAAAFHLHETPLSEDQKIVSGQDGRLMVTATVQNSQELRWWLLGFGRQAEVVKPESLRSELKTISRDMAKIYSTKK